jgi:elongation factor G
MLEKSNNINEVIQVQTYSSEKIRNIALLSHSGAGKTSLAEAMLFNAGAITRLGKVTDGTTTSDYEPEEVKRKISLNLSILNCNWKDTRINILDAPGYPDFVGEVKEGLAVSEGALIVICAASSVEVGTEQSWEFTSKVQMPTFIVINKMDRENANFDNTLKDIRSKLSNKCLPIQIPIGFQKDFKGIIDIVNQKAYTGNPLKETDIPDNLKKSAEDYYNKLVEAVIEVDDELLTKYLDGEKISQEQINSCLKQAIVTGKFIPVMVCSAINNEYISPILDAISSYIPSPIDKAEIEVENGTTGKKEMLKLKSDSPLSALIFKTTTDTHIGRISYFKVVSGEISSNSQVWNVNKGSVERIGQLFNIRGKTQEPAPKIITGDIGSVAKLVVTTTGDSLGVKEHPIKLKAIEFPEVMFCMSVNPKSKADLDKMSSALPRICEEDLTIKVLREPDTGEQLLCGMGETHLEVASEKVSRKFGADIVLDSPKVPYKETIMTRVQTEYKHKKQTGGHGQYGHVFLEMEPLPRGEGFEFGERIVGGSIPRNYIPAVEKGVNEAKTEGVLAKYPVTDVKVTLYDGSYHPVDSSEMSFKIAAIQAFKKGMLAGQPVLLEPVMNMTITVPDQFTGDIIADLNTRGARVMGMNPETGYNVIQAQAPLSVIQRYSIDLRSITQGRGTYNTEFSHYQEVPAQTSQKIVAQRKQDKE